MPSTERRSRRVRAAVCGCGSRTPWSRMADDHSPLFYSPAEQPYKPEKKRDREASEISHRSPHTFLPHSPLTPHQTIYIKEPDRARVQDAKKEIPPPRPTSRRLHPPRASQRHSLLSNHMATQPANRPARVRVRYNTKKAATPSTAALEKEEVPTHGAPLSHYLPPVQGGDGLLQPRAK